MNKIKLLAVCFILFIAFMFFTHTFASGISWASQFSLPTGSNSVYTSSDGSIVMTASGQSSPVLTTFYKSINGGTPTQFATSSLYLVDFVLSSDGTKITAVASAGGIYMYDTNLSNPSWVLKISTYGSVGNRIFMSSNGNNMVAAFNNNTYIWVSVDSGETWTQRTTPTGIVSSVTVSNNGNIFFGSAGIGGGSYLSTDHGINWVQKSSTFFASFPVVDTSGIYYAVIGTSIYKSIDQGANWTKLISAPEERYYQLDVSDDGSVLLGRNSYPGSGVSILSLSVDGGNTWTKETSAGSKEWMDIDVSASGARLSAVSSTLGGAVASMGTNSNIPEPAIYSPLNGSSVTSTWSPQIFWAGANYCEYKFNSGSYNTVSCAQTGADIPAPNVSTSQQILTIRVNGSITASATFSYNPVTYTWTSPYSLSSGTQSIQVSSNGSIIMVGASISGTGTTFYRSLNGGTFSQFATSSLLFVDFALSSNGTKITAVASAGGIYMYDSSLGSPSWVLKTSTSGSSSNRIFTSSNGVYLVATFNGSTYIWVSTDYGSTWTQWTTPRGIVSSITVSNTGVILFGSSGGGIPSTYVSTNNGANWTLQSSVFVPTTPTVDSNEVFYSSSGTSIYKSIDQGANWTKLISAPEERYYQLDVSDDGSVLLGRNSYPGSGVSILSLSVDGGNTWTKETSAGSKEWMDIDVSASGARLSAVSSTLGGAVAVFSTRDGFVSSSDTTAPTLTLVSPLSATTTATTTPNITFTTDEAGTITYGGSCSSPTTSATVGSNTIRLNTLTRLFSYANCTITVTDTVLNASTPLVVPSIRITYRADATLNGSVDIFDLNRLLINFGPSTCLQTRGDFNGDCNVDIFDLNILLRDFGLTAVGQ